MLRGQLFIIAAPSGAGKTSLLKTLLTLDTSLQISISHTTRPPRPGETNGKDYHFISTEQFKVLQKHEEFLEWAQVFDNHYGTSKTWVNNQLDQGKNIILEIDWQGAQQVRQHIKHCISIFILPPSRAALLQRLHKRGQDSERVIQRRMRDAVADMRHYKEFDYVVINDVFETAVDDLHAIVRSQLQRCYAQEVNMGERLTQLLS